MSKRTRKRLFDLLRIAICVGALWIVVRGVTLLDRVTPVDGGADLIGRVVEQGDTVVIELRDGQRRVLGLDEIARDTDGSLRVTLGLLAAWAQSDKMLLLLAVCLHLPVVLFQGLRLKWLLGAQDIRLSFWECSKLSWAGNFLNFATPLGSNAGDVFKAYFTSLHTEKKTEAVTTIVIDRIVGLGSLLLVVALITTFSGPDSRLAQFRPYMLSMLGIGVAGLLAYLSPVVRRRLLPKRLLRRLPMQEQLKRMDETARTVADRKTIVVMSVVITIMLQALAMAAYFTVARSVGLIANLGNVLEYYSCFYVGSIIQALPGPPQGLGTVELAYRYFFAPFGTASQIICVAFLIRLVVLTSALPGLLVTLTGSYKPERAERWHDQLNANCVAVDSAEAPPNREPAASTH